MAAIEFADPFVGLGAVCDVRDGAGSGFEASDSSSQPESRSSSMSAFLEKLRGPTRVAQRVETIVAAGDNSHEHECRTGSIR